MHARIAQEDFRRRSRHRRYTRSPIACAAQTAQTAYRDHRATRCATEQLDIEGRITEVAGGEFRQRWSALRLISARHLSNPRN
jgi:hypothetical protein